MILPVFQDQRVKFNIVNPTLKIELNPAGNRLDTVFLHDYNWGSEAERAAHGSCSQQAEVPENSGGCGRGRGGFPGCSRFQGCFLAEFSFPPSTPPPSPLLATPFPACHTAVLPTSPPDYLSSGFLEQMFLAPSCIENKQALCCHLLSWGKSLCCHRFFLRGSGKGVKSLGLFLTRNSPPDGWQRSSGLPRCAWLLQGMG